MERQHHGGASSYRPSLGFPLGTALLLLVIFSLSGVFSCCYHWDKLRRTLNLHQPPLNPDDLERQPTTKPRPPGQVKQEKKKKKKKKKKKSCLPVIIMPGDHVPKFIAMPCPRQPPVQGRIIVDDDHVHEPPFTKPPVPLY